MALKKLIKRKDKKKRYQPGGMYSNNTVPTALSTTNLVQQESDPNILKAQEEKLEQTSAKLQEQAQAASEKIEQDKEVADQQIEIAGENATAGVDAGVSGLKNIADKFVKPEAKKKAGNPFAGAVKAFKNVRAAKATVKSADAFNKAKSAFDVSRKLSGATKNFGNLKSTLDLSSSLNKVKGLSTNLNKGISLAKNTKTGLEGAKLATTFGKDGYAAVNASTQALAKGSAVGAGLKNFATSGAGIGTIASLAGAGVSKLSDDNDATTMNFGEGAGKTLSGIGAGVGAATTAAMLTGSALGPVGTLVGAGVGALYGLGKGFIQRGKARREERKLENERKAFTTKANKKTSERFAAAAGAVRSANLKRKMVSGYDLGRNTTAMLGGLRMGMPRYGN